MSYESLPRDFKGIWIPKEIWLHPDLSCTEKCLWAEIDSLDREIEGCTASNAYLGKLFDLSERSLREKLSRLRNMGLIIYEKTDGRIRTMRSSVKTLLRTSDRQNSTKPNSEGRKPAPRDGGNPPPSTRDHTYKENKVENPPLPPPLEASKEEEEEILRRKKERPKGSPPIKSYKAWSKAVLEQIRLEKNPENVNNAVIKRHMEKARSMDFKKQDGFTVIACKDWVEFTYGSHVSVVPYAISDEEWSKQTGWPCK